MTKVNSGLKGLNPWIHARWLMAAIKEMTKKTDCIIEAFLQTGLK